MEEEEGIKSAFELAMERISGLPKLTPEEKAEQKEREYAPIGTSIAVKYMDGALADSELPIQLKRYDGIHQRIVRRALISSLCREINFANGRDTVRKAWNGVSRIAPEQRGALESIEKSFWEISAEFEAAKEQRFREFVISANDGIKKLGISGSAIRPNLNENEQWEQELNEARKAYEPKLKNIVDSLMRELGSS